jgi:hypothetical protein
MAVVLQNLSGVRPRWTARHRRSSWPVAFEAARRASWRSGPSGALMAPPPLTEAMRGNETGPPSIVSSGDRYAQLGRVFVLHKANMSSGETRTTIELGDFLGRGKAGAEHEALAGLIGSLIDEKSRQR